VKKVVVLGAGNVGMDCACEAFHPGACQVTAVDVQKHAAFGKELDRALALGTRILYPRKVKEYNNGELLFIDGTFLQADFLIEAVGEVPELDFVGEKLLLNSATFTTNLPRVYVGGDVLFSGLVTHSIGMGRNLALMLHSIFQGTPYQVPFTEVVDKRKVNTVYFEQSSAFSSCLEKCLCCSTCIQYDICVESCPRGAVKRSGEEFFVDVELCSGCGVCASVCPRGAITLEPKTGGLH